MSDNKDLEQLLKNIQDSLKVYSIKELNQAIIVALNEKHDKTIEINYILDIVSSHYKISIKQLKGRYGKGRIADAKQIAYCLLYFNLGIPIRQIAMKIFFNWPTSVTIGIKRLKNADIKVKSDKEFKDTYQLLTEKLIKVISQEKEKLL
jgi:chromosomal replication initiation ATPase DnaA